MIPSSSSALSTRVGLSAMGILRCRAPLTRGVMTLCACDHAAGTPLAGPLLQDRAAMPVLLHTLWQGFLLQPTPDATIDLDQSLLEACCDYELSLLVSCD